MASGLFVLLIEDLNWFLVGLALIVAGNGLFKPNISTMIGKLYSPGDVRRDSGFTIFYMSINLGAFIAPFVTAAWIGAIWGLKYGFLAAGIGMILSTLFLEMAKKSLGHIGRPLEGKGGLGAILRRRRRGLCDGRRGLFPFVGKHDSGLLAGRNHDRAGDQFHHRRYSFR